jgi:hypothetical protein
MQTRRIEAEVHYDERGSWCSRADTHGHRRTPEPRDAGALFTHPKQAKRDAVSVLDGTNAETVGVSAAVT